MRNLARNHRRAQIPFRPVVGRLDAVLAEKPQYAAPVMLRADAVQQSLIVRVAQIPVPQVERQPIVQLLYPFPIVPRAPAVLLCR